MHFICIFLGTENANATLFCGLFSAFTAWLVASTRSDEV